MALLFGRLVAKTLTRPINNASLHLPKSFSNSQWSRFRSKSSGINLGSSPTVPAVCVTLGLAGSALYLKYRHDSLPDILMVKAANAEEPCGAKPGKGKGAGRIKIAGPCQPKKKKCGPEPQPNVTSGLKKYSLFLWITLEADADPCAVACAAAQIDEAIAATKGFDCDVDDEILAGVGFGPNFLSQNCLSPAKNFCYRTRKGKRGEMPSSNGDIFVHAKADSLGQLFDFCKTYLHNFPDDSVCEFEDVYGFSFRGTRDISGFPINQTNRCKEEGLREVAVECTSGGSYALAQKWVHDLCVLEEEQATLECYIGRKMDTGEELPERTASAHVTRMTGSCEPASTPTHEIVQQTMSYGCLSERAGLFFLAFASDPCVFDWMLDRMVGANCEDAEHDDVMRISKNIKGTYFYFPGNKDIQGMKGQS